MKWVTGEPRIKFFTRNIIRILAQAQTSIGPPPLAYCTPFRLSYTKPEFVVKVSDILHSLFNNKLKHVHRQLARCNPLFHFLNVLVPIGFVLVGQKIIILISIAPWCPRIQRCFLP